VASAVVLFASRSLHERVVSVVALSVGVLFASRSLHEKEVCGVSVSVSPREKGVSAQVSVVEEDMCDVNLTGGLGGL